MAKKEENTKQSLMLFSAVDPYAVTNIVNGDEKEVRGYDFIAWGANNDYPDYLLSLYKNVPLLETLINASTDYTCGDGVNLSKDPFNIRVNDTNETVETLVRRLCYDYWTYGAFAINVVRNKLGGIAGLYYLDIKNIRTDKKNERFWYAEDWAKSYGRVKAIEYPKYDINATKVPSSIFYVKGTFNTAYGTPVWSASVKAAEIMKAVDEYQLNAINNGFMASYIISLNNGQPAPEIQQEIEDQINEKFSGYNNGGRIMLYFGKDADHKVTVEKIEQDNVGDRYKSLVEWSKEQLFTSFRCAPQLVGINAEKTGFNDSDYQEAYKLFNRTMIRPVQRTLCDAFNAIFGENVMTIKPFTIDFTDEEKSTTVK